MSKQKILIVFYSLGGSLVKVAKEIAKGAREVEGTEVEIKRVKELTPDEVFEKNPRMKRDKLAYLTRFRERGQSLMPQKPSLAVAR